MDRCGRRCGVGVRVKAEEGAEAEMLHDGEFRQYFCVVHFDHAFVDFAPARADTGDVVEHGGMFPKRPLFDIVDEADGTEVHVLVPAPFDGGDFGDVRGVGGVRKGSFDWGLVGR